MLGSIALMIQQKAAEHPGKIAIYVGNENCTYEALARNNRKAALYLTNKGIRPNERIVVEADHILSYVYFWYGIQLLGATFVPVEKATPSNRIREIATELDASAIVTLTPREDLQEAWNLQDMRLKAFITLQILTKKQKQTLLTLFFWMLCCRTWMVLKYCSR